MLWFAYLLHQLQVIVGNLLAKVVQGFEPLGILDSELLSTCLPHGGAMEWKTKLDK